LSGREFDDEASAEAATARIVALADRRISTVENFAHLLPQPRGLALGGGELPRHAERIAAKMLLVSPNARERALAL